MNTINFDFFEEFKKLDKLCGNLYKEQHGITHYIDDMKAVPGLNYLDIPNWKMDLEQLIRLRHIRNHLAHTEGAFSENICTQKDIDWIQAFYQRILEQSDPIALLYQKSKLKNQTVKQTNNQVINKNSTSYEGVYLFLILVFIVFIVLIIVGGVMLLAAAL